MKTNARKLLCLLLCLCLSLSLFGAAAAGLDSFKKVRSYKAGTFSDVAESDWYSENVAAIYELGLMVGQGDGTFGVGRNLTVAETLAVAARLHAIYNGKDADFVQGKPWYQVYADYIEANTALRVRDLTMDAAATRGQFATFLSAVFPDEALKAINSVADDAIPDVKTGDPDASAIYRLYRAGIIIGIDDAGTYAPGSAIKRSEVAAIVTRMVDESLRKTVKLGSAFTVTFDLNYGDKGALTTVSVAEGKTVARPADPSRTGYEFLGWFTAARNGSEYDFGKAVTGDLTLYAHWAEAKEEEDDGGFYDDGEEEIPDLESAEILRNGAADVYAVADDVLTVKVLPENAEYTVRWLAGSTVLGEGDSYTVSALNLGQSIVAEVTGAGGYDGTVTSAALPILNSMSFDVSASDPDAAPVAFTGAAAVTFLDGEGNEVAVSGDSEITLEITPKGDTDADAALDGESEEKTDAAAAALAAASGQDLTITYEDVKDEIGYTAVEVALTLTQDGEETELHPVGETTVTLSKENLGLDADADLSLFVFFASHTNAAGEEEVVAGELVTVDGADYIRFTLNGLSRIWLGNVPPRTVTFDANGGAPTPEPQKVKFGGYAAYVEPPLREGMLFIGWDHDLNTENIIHDITVKALWTEGHIAQDGQLTGRWLVSGSPVNPTVTTTVSNGIVNHLLDGDSYDANLSYELTVGAPAGAVAYTVDVSAESAASSTNVRTIAEAGLPKLTVRATDASGNVLSVNTAIYIKWIGEDGTALDLQSARVIIRKSSAPTPGSYDTETYTETVAVNRGIGTAEVWLTDGPEGQDDYVAYVNGYLNERSTSDGETEYYLRPYFNFNRNFNYRNDAGERIRTDAADYRTLKIVISPFEGQRFTTLPEVSAYYRKYGEDGRSTRVDYSFGSVTLEDGKIVLTGERPTDSGDTYTYLYVTLTLNGVSTQIDVHMRNASSSVERTSRNCETWDEVLAAVAEGIQRIYYEGSQDVILTTTLTVPEDVSIEMWSRNFTVGNGGKLILTVGAEAGSDLYANSVTVARGGEITTVLSDTVTGTRHVPFVIGEEGGITVQNGGRIYVPDSDVLHVQNGAGGFIVEQGGEIVVEGTFYSYRDSGSETISMLSGTLTVSDYGDVDFDDTLEVSETGVIDVTDRGRLEIYAGLINRGTVNCGGNSATLSGRSENYGTIVVTQNYLSMLNTGYTVVNEGTIQVASGATLDCTGTVLLNNGRLTGTGTLENGEFFDTTDYDNGIEYVESTNNRPNDYSRYMFVRDPADSVEMIHFIGALTGSGTCSLTIIR